MNKPPESSVRSASEPAAPGAEISADRLSLRYFNPADLTFFMTGALLRLTVAGEYSCLHVAIHRLFPLSHPTEYFSIRDGGGQELGLLRTLDDLTPAGRDCVAAALARRYMTAEVRKIVRVRERFGIVEWEVETHRGVCRFATRDLRDNIRRLSAVHYIIPDVDGNRYDIPNLTALDAHSQARLLRHL